MQVIPLARHAHGQIRVHTLLRSSFPLKWLQANMGLYFSRVRCWIVQARLGSSVMKNRWAGGFVRPTWECPSQNNWESHVFHLWNAKWKNFMGQYSQVLYVFLNVIKTGSDIDPENLRINGLPVGPVGWLVQPQLFFNYKINGHWHTNTWTLTYCYRINY